MDRVDLEREVLAMLESTGAARRPNELVAAITERQRVSKTAVREAIWHLLDANRVKLTTDLRLKAAHVRSAVHA